MIASTTLVLQATVAEDFEVKYYDHFKVGIGLGGRNETKHSQERTGRQEHQYLHLTNDSITNNPRAGGEELAQK